MTKVFTNLPTAEAWLRWHGLTRYLGLLRYDDGYGGSSAEITERADGTVAVFIRWAE